MQIKWYFYKWCPHKIQFIADLAVKKLLKSDHFCRSSVPLKINSCYWDILYLLEILEYIWTTKYLKNYQRFQFYGLYVPILDVIPYVVTKCTVGLAKFQCCITIFLYLVYRAMISYKIFKNIIGVSHLVQRHNLFTYFTTQKKFSM